MQEALVQELRQGALDANAKDGQVRRANLRLIIHKLFPSPLAMEHVRMQTCACRKRHRIGAVRLRIRDEKAAVSTRGGGGGEERGLLVRIDQRSSQSLSGFFRTEREIHGVLMIF